MSPTQREVLRNFFKDLLNPEDRAASPGTSAVSPGAGTTDAVAGKPTATDPTTSSGGCLVALVMMRVRAEVRRRILMWAVGLKRWIGGASRVPIRLMVVSVAVD
jgi:hypothetical protein